MGEQALGRRERRKRATRDALSEAAVRLCSEQGLERVTVEHIADEADVARRTFFNYFSSKEEAVAAGDAAVAEAVVAVFCERPVTEPVLTAVRQALLAVVGEDGFQGRVGRMRGEHRTPALLSHQLAAFVTQERALAQAVADRSGCDVDRDLYPALVAAGVMAGLRVVVHRWLNPPRDDAAGPPLTELVEQALDQLSAGLEAPVGSTVPSVPSP